MDLSKASSNNRNISVNMALTVLKISETIYVLSEFYSHINVLLQLNNYAIERLSSLYEHLYAAVYISDILCTFY